MLMRWTMGNEVGVVSLRAPSGVASRARLASWRDAVDVLSPVVVRIEALLAPSLAKGDRVERSKIFSASNSTATASLTVARGDRVGATIGLWWKPGAEEIHVTITPMSLRERRSQWAVLGVGLVLGLVGAKAALPPEWAPQLRFALGLVLGCVFALLLTVLVSRAGLFTDRARSSALVEVLRPGLAPLFAEVSGPEA